MVYWGCGFAGLRRFPEEEAALSDHSAHVVIPKPVDVSDSVSRLLYVGGNRVIERHVVEQSVGDGFWGNQRIS